MKIGTNIPALTAIRNMQRSQLIVGNSISNISSGKSIQKAQDDAAGHAISEKMKLQIIGLKRASKNSLDAVSLIQTGEGALNEMHAMIQRMRELAVQSANGTNTTEDREAIQQEIDQLTDEVNKISQTSDFNAIKLLNGNTSPKSNAQVVRMSCGGPYSVELQPNIGSIKDDDEIFIKMTEGGVTEEIKLNVEGLSSYGDKKEELLFRVRDAVGDKANVYFKDNNKNEIIIESKSVGGDSSIKFYGKDSAARLNPTPSEAKSVPENYNNNAKGSINFTNVPEDGSVIVIGTKTIGFYDSTKSDKGSNTIEIDINGKGIEAIRDEVISEYNRIETEAKPPKSNDAYIVDDLNLTKDLKSKIIIESPFKGEVGEVFEIGGQIDYKEIPVQFGANAKDMMFLKLEDVSATALRIASISQYGNTRVVGARYSDTRRIHLDQGVAPTQYALDITSQERATSAIQVYDNAIARVSEVRSRMGAVQNRLERTISNLDSASENMTQSMSRISDADIAEEFTTFTNQSIISQSANAMLAQANQFPSMVMKLLEM